MMRSTDALHRMTRPAKTSGLAVLLLAVGLGAAACGGGDDEPLSANDLCTVIDDIDEDSTIGDAVEQLDGVELSDEIPTEAAEGLGAMVELLKDMPQDVSGDALDDELEKLDPSDIDAETGEKVGAFNAWSESNCD